MQFPRCVPISPWILDIESPHYPLVSPGVLDIDQLLALLPIHLRNSYRGYQPF
jgi:hypothetical protein